MLTAWGQDVHSAWNHWRLSTLTHTPWDGASVIVCLQAQRAQRLDAPWHGSKQLARRARAKLGLLHHAAWCCTKAVRCWAGAGQLSSALARCC